MKNKVLQPAPASIESLMIEVSGQKVLDADLAGIYEVSTKALNQAVKRNLARFPGDFRFRLTTEEVGRLNRSQSVTGSQKHRDPRSAPYAFTEPWALLPVEAIL